MTVKITALLAAHNRRESTLQSLENLYRQQGNGEAFDLSVVLADDGSTDGTGEAIRRRFPQARVVRGDGSLFWCGGMCFAYEHSVDIPADFYLLLNDDTYLYEDAIRRALRVYEEKSASGKTDLIIVGSTRNPDTGELSYGGEIRVSNWHPFRYNHVQPGDRPQHCDTLNGNFVLVHKSVIDKVGFLDKRYTHRFGDTDYGLVASKAGCELWVIPGFVGECAENAPEINWDSAAYSFPQRVRMFFDVKGMPVRESRIFCRKHGGLLWPVFWMMPIVRGLFFPTRYETEQAPDSEAALPKRS